MYKVRHCIDSEAYISGLARTRDNPAAILHCFFFESHLATIGMGRKLGLFFILKTNSQTAVSCTEI